MNVVEEVERNYRNCMENDKIGSKTFNMIIILVAARIKGQHKPTRGHC